MSNSPADSLENLASHPTAWGREIAEDRKRRANGSNPVSRPPVPEMEPVWGSGRDGESGFLDPLPDGAGPPERPVGEGEAEESTARLLTAEEFETDLAPDAIVAGLVYEASTILVTGASKTGKTWWALQLAQSVVAGREFLGLEAQPMPALLCSLELSAGMVRERMKAISSAIGLPMPRVGEALHVVAPTAAYVPQIDLSSEQGRSTLRELLATTGARLVVLDTLYRFLPGVDPNDNGEMGAVFGALNDLAQETGAAVLIIDHVGKGDRAGPVSHSALGASVKGGAARVIAALKRTSKDDGGKWELDVESHFGSWDEPIHFERPVIDDQGTRGGGCVLCTATQARGLDEATVHRVFRKHGIPDASGRSVIASKRKLVAALEAEDLCSGNAHGEDLVGAILRDYCRPEGAIWGDDRPIFTKDGPNRATVFTWRMPEPEVGSRAS